MTDADDNSIKAIDIIISIIYSVELTDLKNVSPITAPPLNRAALVIHTGSLDN